MYRTVSTAIEPGPSFCSRLGEAPLWTYFAPSSILHRNPVCEPFADADELPGAHPAFTQIATK